MSKDKKTAATLSFKEAVAEVERISDAATAATCKSAAEAQSTLKSYGQNVEVAE